MRPLAGMWDFPPDEFQARFRQSCLPGIWQEPFPFQPVGQGLGKSSDHGRLAIRAAILGIPKLTLRTPNCCLLLPRGFRKSLEENKKAGRCGEDRNYVRNVISRSYK